MGGETRLAEARFFSASRAGVSHTVGQSGNLSVLSVSRNSEVAADRWQSRARLRAKNKWDSWF